MKRSTETTVHPDQKYIDALITNDASVLNELYQKFSGSIKSMVLKNSGSEADAGDVFQDALMSIFISATKKNFILTCPLEAYLYIICKKRWVSKLNKRKSDRVTFTDIADYNGIGENSFELAEDCLLQHDRQELLEEQFNNLDEQCKELLSKSWSGFSVDEVARMFDRSNGHSRTKKSKCKKKLVRLVKESPKFQYMKW